MGWLKTSGRALPAALGAAWGFVRQWSGDAAYERYLAHAGASPKLGRKAFYLESLRRRYRGPSRCC